MSVTHSPIASLFSNDAGIRIRECDPWSIEPDRVDLTMEEIAQIRGAVESRVREFRATRLLAREALAGLGYEGGQVKRHSSGMPLWPTGVVGSITHTKNWCGVVVGLSNDYLSIGVDIEAGGPLEEELWPIICTPQELDTISALPARERGVSAKIHFSAKESLFKAIFPLTGKFFDFHSACLRINPSLKEWRVEYLVSNVGFGAPASILSGTYNQSGGLVATAICLQHHPAASRNKFPFIARREAASLKSESVR